MSDPPRGSWDEEDRALVRTLGARLSQIIHGEDLDIPDLQRRDELGILANMVSRLAHELRASRRQDRQYREELEHRVEQLQAAYTTQEKLLATIRELPSPVLEPYKGVLLVPIVGASDAARISQLAPALLERVAAHRPRAVIFHLATGASVTPEAAAVLLRACHSTRHFGAQPMLSGIETGEGNARLGGVDFTHVMPCERLEDALVAALDLCGYRITR